MDNEQPILGIVATINGSDITEGANQLVNNVGRIEKAADGAANSLTKAFSTLQLQLTKVNEQLKLAEAQMRSIQELSAKKPTGTTTDNKAVELEGKVNQLLKERAELLRKIEQQQQRQQNNNVVFGGGATGGASTSNGRHQIREIQRQQKEHEKSLQEALNRRAAIEARLVELEKELSSDVRSKEEIDNLKNLIEQQKAYIATLGEVKEIVKENGEIIHVIPNGWQNANDTLRLYQSQLDKLQSANPAAKEMKQLEEELDNIFSSIEHHTKKIDEGKESINGITDEMAEAKKQGETLQKQLRAIREEMRRMKLNGQDNTPEYEELAEKAKKLQKVIKQTNADADSQTPIFAKLTGGLQNYKDMLSQLPAPIKASITSMNQLIKVGMRLIATPIGAAIMVLVGAFKMLSSYLNNTSEGQKIWAKFSGYGEGVLNYLTRKVYALIDAIRGAKNAIPSEEEFEKKAKSKSNSKQEEKEERWWIREEIKRIYDEGDEWGAKGRYALRSMKNSAENDIKFYKGRKDEEGIKAYNDAVQLLNDVETSIGNLNRQQAGFWGKVGYRIFDTVLDYGNAVRKGTDYTVTLSNGLSDAAKAMAAYKENIIEINKRLENQKLLDANYDYQIGQLNNSLGNPYLSSLQRIGLNSQIGNLRENKINDRLSILNDKVNAIARQGGAIDITAILNAVRKGEISNGELNDKYGIKDGEDLKSTMLEIIGLETELASTTANTTNTIQQQQLELIEARQQYVTAVLQSERQLSRQQADAIYEQNKVAFNALADSFEKRKKLREAEHQYNLLMIEREKEDAINAAKETARSEYNSNPNIGRRVWDESLLNIEFGSAAYNKLNSHDKGIFERYAQAVGIAGMTAQNKTVQENADYLGVDELIEKYQNFTMQRIALDTEYQMEHERITQAIAAQEKILMDETASQQTKNNANVQKARLNGALAELDEEFRRRRESVAQSQLQRQTQNDSLYKMANGNLDGLNVSTLRVLTGRLNQLKEIPNLSEEQIHSLNNLIENIDNKIVKNNSLQDLINAEEKLQDLRYEEAALAKGITNAKVSGSDTVTYTHNGVVQQMSMKEATDRLEQIGRGIQTQTQNMEKSAASISNDLSKINSSLQNIGQQIGGVFGDLLSAIGSISNSIVSGLENAQNIANNHSVTDASGNTKLDSIGKFQSVLLGVETIISVATAAQDFVDKISNTFRAEQRIKEINRLEDSVNRYRLAMLKASAAENDWFGNSSLRDLNSLLAQSQKVYEEYYSKLYQTQVKYRDKSRNDNNWTTLLGNYYLGGLTFGYKWKDIPNNSDVEYESAINNLRIETRARHRSFFGIGGQNQRTEDLRSWAKQQYGDELFDDKGMVNTEMAKEIISTYGDKLQGETKATLEELIGLKETYDEYMSSLKDYVNNLYSPLADAMTNAIWDWYQNGVDALTSFRNAASDVFKNIANDLLQTIVMKKIFGTFEDDILKMYDSYNSGQLSEEQLMSQVGILTSQVISKYESEIPMLENLLSTMDNTLQNTSGISMGQSSLSSATQGVVTGATQDTINEANGRMAAIQMGQQEMIIYQSRILEYMTTQSVDVTAINTSVGYIRGDVSDIKGMMDESNTYLRRIEANTSYLLEMSENIRSISQNTQRL